MNKTYLSVIAPVYGCKESLLELYLKLKETLSSITQDFEILLIDDRGNDNPWALIRELAEKDSRVKGYQLSRNFGQHKAIFAGLEKSKGEWVVVMDCDLQEPPKEIAKLHEKAMEGYDMVLGRRIERKHRFLKRSFSKLFYMLLGYLTNTKQDSTISNFGIYNRKVIDAVCSMNDTFKYFPTMIRWVGFNHTTIEIEHSDRIAGKTSYSMKKLIDLGLEVILAFSEKPLRLTIKLGIFISFLSFLFAIFTFIRYLLGIIEVGGYSSLIISIWFLAGIIIIILGIVGLYVGKTFEKVKERPDYIIRQCTDNG